MAICYEDFGYVPRFESEFKERTKWNLYTHTRGAPKIQYEGRTKEEAEPEAAMEIWFKEHAERWQNETAIHSAPGAAYLHKDYIKIIAKGIEHPRSIVPLILNRLSDHGGDWFFALENITNANPAKDCEDFNNAVKAWYKWEEERD